MTGEPKGGPVLWIRPNDDSGKPINAEILAAAQRNWKRLLLYAERHGEDASSAAEILDGVVHSLASTVERHPGFRERIKDLDDYVFGMAAHGLNRLRPTEPDVEFVGSAQDLSTLAGAHDSRWASDFEKELALREIERYMSKRTRHLLRLRTVGYSWEEIAQKIGTTANNAQVLYNQGVAWARKRILGRKRSRTGSEPGRPK